MGKPDEYFYNYLDDNVRFADQMNGALFRGRQVVKPEDLEPADAQAVYLGREAGGRENFKAIVDKARMWKGRLVHILLVENQTHVDYHMVIRNMLSESLSYHKQWKQMRLRHDRKKDLKIGSDEFFSGMARDEKFVPVITLVVYCGTEHRWDGAKCLYEVLDVDDEVKAYVTNYKLNLYDCHEHDAFDEYHTGLRQLFEAVRYGSDKEQLKRVMEENKEIYNNIDRDTKELLEVVAKVRIPEGYKVMRNGEERFEVCKAFADYRLEGKLEGKLEEKQEHFIMLVCKKLQKNKPAEIIAEEVEEELSDVERIIAAQKQVGSYDVGEICKALEKR